MKPKPQNMKKYFYSDGTTIFGPFTLEELKEKGISRETSVWFQELGEWKKAETVQELNKLFAYIPPPVPQQNKNFQSPVQPISTNDTIDILVFISIAYWVVVNLANVIIQKVVDDWYNTPAKYFQIGTNLIFAVIPIIFALSIRNKTLKIIALILSASLSIYLLYSNIGWLIRELK